MNINYNFEYSVSKTMNRGFQPIKVCSLSIGNRSKPPLGCILNIASLDVLNGTEATGNAVALSKTGRIGCCCFISMQYQEAELKKKRMKDEVK